jgi:hypothetical protein
VAGRDSPEWVLGREVLPRRPPPPLLGLLAPEGLPVAQRVHGDALTVLHTVLTD